MGHRAHTQSAALEHIFMALLGGLTSPQRFTPQRTHSRPPYHKKKPHPEAFSQDTMVNVSRRLPPAPVRTLRGVHLHLIVYGAYGFVTSHTEGHPSEGIHGGLGMVLGPTLVIWLEV